MKFCVDCRFYVVSPYCPPDRPEFACQRPRLDLVTGKTHSSHLDPSFERYSRTGDQCSPDARFFEPK